MDEYISKILKDNELIKVSENVFLTNYQMDVLNKYHIPFSECSSINEIIFYVEDILNEDDSDCEDLETVSTSLAEIDYYANYKK